MSGRIGRAFDAARLERRGAFLPFLTSGFPDLAESDRLASALCEEGADVLELGVPFSDPVADGPTIQGASESALRAGATLPHVLEQVKALRARHPTPIALMSYFNPILRHGPDRFIEDARGAGVDGVILVDVPPEEEPSFWGATRAAGIETIALVAPSTDPGRLPHILARASGFLYVVARLGVTGHGSGDPHIDALLERCRSLSPLPRCLGFGIDLETPLARYRGSVEGVVVGSALIESLLGASDARGREERVRGFARRFRGKLPDLAPG